MATPFAALEARINAAVDQHLSNATADFGGGVTVDGLFSMAFIEQQGVEGLRPVFSVSTSALPTVPTVSHSTAVTINAVAYRVVGIQPDAGRTTLLLEKT